jgi:hypothetical protein
MDIVTANGKVATSVDLGAGYKYAVLVEDAKVNRCRSVEQRRARRTAHGIVLQVLSNQVWCLNYRA